MRCSARSTTWAGRAVAAFVLVGERRRHAQAAAAVTDEVVRAGHRAGGRAAGRRPRRASSARPRRQARVGRAKAACSRRLPSEAKAGAPTRVVLKVLQQDGRASRFGEATCVIDLTLTGLRATRADRAGTASWAADDLEAVVVEAERVAASGAAAGTRGWAGRDRHRRRPGAPAVDGDAGAAGEDGRRGDGHPEARADRGRGTGDRRAERVSSGTSSTCSTPESKRRLAARITGRGLVEVQHGR